VIDLEYAFLADAVEVRPDGRWGALGAGISGLVVERTPALYPRLVLMLGLLVTTLEAGEQHDLTIDLRAPDGELIAETAFAISSQGRADGSDHVASTAVRFDEISFDEAGRYFFEIAIDGRPVKRLPLLIRLSDPG
jgi:hypothetical protein